MVIDSFPVSTQPNDQISPALAYGSGDQFLITYSGFCDSINKHPANTMRIWGKFSPFVGVEEDFARSEFLFLQIEPNPFHSSTRVKYALTKSSAVSLKVYNIAGQGVRNLVNGKENPGVYEVNWNGEDDAGRKLPQGIYFLRMEADEYTGTKKVVLLH